jgi:5-methylcytosine-specific restriction endonuclease McrA
LYIFNPQPKIKREKLSHFKWKRRRQECYERDNFTCRHCGKRHVEEDHSLSPHHIKSKARGGGDELKNLASLCLMSCHRLVTDGKIANDFKN